ncbi:MAG: YesL family protein [Anaerolineae bacterium]
MKALRTSQPRQVADAGPDAARQAGSAAQAWHVVRAALHDTWEDLLNTAIINLLWLILTVLVVTAPPAAVALFYTANRIARGEPTDPLDFLAAFRRYFGLGWRWGALQVVMLFLLVGDVYLSGRLSPAPAGRLAQGLYLAGLAFWLLLQVLSLAFLFEQESPSVRLALRNGVVMLGNNLLFSAALGLLVLLLLAAGVLFFCVASAAGGVFVALVGNHAVLNRLDARR